VAYPWYENQCPVRVTETRSTTPAFARLHTTGGLATLAAEVINRSCGNRAVGPLRTSFTALFSALANHLLPLGAMRRTLSVVALAAAMLLITASSALANVGPYSGQGYDASSYQCTNGVPNGVDPNFTSFGITRVTGGRPFSLDSCRQALWTQAVNNTNAPSLYVNVAYSGAYGHHVAGYCSTALSPERYGGRYLQAWRIGCAESDFAYGNILTSTKAPTAWWLDVETGNSWSSSDRGLNEAAIDGAADQLKFRSGGGAVGVYSYASAWNTITSGPSFRPASASGAWVAGESSCLGSFSSRLPEWLYQHLATSAGADADYAC